MRILKSNQSIVVLFSIMLIFVLGVFPLLAEKKHKISGKMTCAVTETKEVEVCPGWGLTMSLGEYEGVNYSTDEQKFMDGAQVHNVSFGDLKKGNGPHQGYARMMHGDDGILSKWEGTVTTTMTSEGVPQISFEGTLSFVKGTGQFENIKGTGTYKGHFISKTIYEAEWQGEYGTE